jgi:hypothetical protein
MNTQNLKSVQRHLAEMIDLEKGIEQILSREQETNDDSITPFLERFGAMAKDHREALEVRMLALQSLPDMPALKADGGVPLVLTRLYGALCEAALSYAMIHSMSHRAFDREGTRDMVKKHLKDYAQAANEINLLVMDEVLWELDREGDECACQCTTCALGICTCSPMGIGRTNKEWLDTVSSGALGGILVTAPRKGSSAARAGLHAGDVILAADGQDIHANAELHAAIKKHAAGETVVLKVRRTSGGVENINVVC